MAVGLRCVYLGLALMHVPWIEVALTLQGGG